MKRGLSIVLAAGVSFGLLYFAFRNVDFGDVVDILRGTKLGWLPVLLALPVMGFVLGTPWKVYGMVKAKKRYALLHPLAALILSAILLDAFHVALFKKPTQWR